jgi:hypothetical protein
MRIAACKDGRLHVLRYLSIDLQCYAAKNWLKQMPASLDTQLTHERLTSIMVLSLYLLRLSLGQRRHGILGFCYEDDCSLCKRDAGSHESSPSEIGT